MHLVSFFVMIVLYQRIESHKPLDQEKTIKEMEDLLVSYTTEMKENNERLVRRVSRMPSKDVLKGKSELSDPIVQDENEIKKASHSSRKSALKNEATTSTEKEMEADITEEYNRYEPPAPSEEKEEVSFDSSNTARVLSLSEQGFSHREIAKKMQMGAGEVELLLKFYK